MSAMAASQEIVLSIVIPCFNHGQYLLEALESVERYPRNDCEVLIINDGSTEAPTLKILGEIRDRGYAVIDQPNRGLANARNTGIAAASGRYILPLDSDNKIRPDYIHQGIAILDAQPAVGVVYGDVAFFGEQIGRWDLPDFDLQQMLVRNYIDACAVFRKVVWQDCGGYDEQIPDKLGYEDWDFWLTAAARGWQFHHIPSVTYDYRVRSDSMVQTCKIPENQKRLVHYLCQKHLALYTADVPGILAEKEYWTFQQLSELRSQLEQRERELHQCDARLQRSQEQLHGTEERLFYAETRLREVLDELRQTQSESERDRERLRAMETSKFWKLRSLWLRLKRFVGFGRHA